MAPILGGDLKSIKGPDYLLFDRLYTHIVEEHGQEMLHLNLSPVTQAFLLQRPVHFFSPGNILLHEVVYLLEAPVTALAQADNVQVFLFSQGQISC